MPNKRSLYIGTYDNNWLTFIYRAGANDKELENYFRNWVYVGEYGGESLDLDEPVEISEIKTAYNYDSNKDYKIKVSIK